MGLGAVARQGVFALTHLLPCTRQYRELRAQRPSIMQAVAALREELNQADVKDLAIPSYTHRNPLMRFLVWQRLAVAIELLDRMRPTPRVVMDYGCGIGPLFPALARRKMKVIACDIRPEAAQIGARSLGIREIEVLDAREGLSSIASGAVDTILALEVLEHVDDLETLATAFGRVLSERGVVLCSLPTENAVYRMGRRLSGFSGEYHVRKPEDIIATLRSFFETETVAQLYPGVPLYQFFECRLH